MKPSHPQPKNRQMKHDNSVQNKKNKSSLRIPQAALGQQATIGMTRAACGIRKKEQTGLTAGLGTAFPQKGVPNIVR
jgi:hypothetical protein